MSQITCYDTPPAGWDEFVIGHPDSKVYHRSAWLEIVRKTFGHKTFYLVSRDGDLIDGVLPLTEFKSLLFGKIAVSLPYINYGDPLMSGGDADAFFSYLKSFRERENFKSVELRCSKEFKTDVPCRQHKVTFFLDLPDDPEKLMKSFKAKLRSQVRRPTKDNMTARSGGIELLDDFYHCFTVNMRDLGTPVLPRHFFEEILKAFPEHAFIATVYAEDGRPAASSFLIRYGDTMEIPWASSLREFNRSSPNMLMYWESLRLSIEKGCKRFDYGRCNPDGGTYRFKKQWGAIETPLYWYYVLPESEALPEMSPSNSKFDMVIKVWQKLPLALTNLIGPRIIKHIP